MWNVGTVKVRTVIIGIKLINKNYIIGRDQGNHKHQINHSSDDVHHA